MHCGQGIVGVSSPKSNYCSQSEIKLSTSSLQRNTQDCSSMLGKPKGPSGMIAELTPCGPLQLGLVLQLPGHG